MDRSGQEHGSIPLFFKSRSPQWLGIKATIFTQLSEPARQELRRKGLRINERIARLGRIEDAIEYGRSLIGRYGAATLGELPEAEQVEFARLWVHTTGGAKLHEN